MVSYGLENNKSLKRSAFDRSPNQPMHMDSLRNSLSDQEKMPRVESESLESLSALKDEISDFSAESGKEYYLLSNAWYAKFSRYVSSMSSSYHPGPIDNSCILLNEELKPDIEEADVYPVTEEIFNKLVDTFGLLEQFHQIKRQFPIDPPEPTRIVPTFLSDYKKPALVGGVTGLRNLGNTCFMNSALQCLSNTALLTRYFLSGDWKLELNRENPLGMHGQVAEAYANLILNLWKQTDASFAPMQFKSTIGRFNSTFIGYSQQDSQELLNFLLDGLHEDLNRIKKKPYVEMPDMSQFPEEEIAKKSWELYRKRNDSVIVDLFQGEYKSRVICTKCNKQSLTFDPYMFLSVPVPEKKQIQFTFYVLSFKSCKWFKATLNFKKTALFSELKKRVAEMFQLNQMFVVELFQGKIYKIYRETDRLSHVMSNDVIYVIEPAQYGIHFNDSLTNGANDSLTHQTDLVLIPVYLKAQESTYSFRELFTFPLVIQMPSKISAESTEKAIEKVSLIARAQVSECFRVFGISEIVEFKLSLIQPEYKRPADPYHTDSLARFYNSGWSVNCISTECVSSTRTISENSIDEMQQEQVEIDLSGETVFLAEIESEDSISERVTQTPSYQEPIIESENSTIRLFDCLNEYVKEELLGEKDTWYCPNCKEHVRIKKKIDIWSVPKVLVIHLKRFSSDRSVFRSLSGDKIDCLVDFPLENLNLDMFVHSKNSLYNLFAVSNHFGGLGGGHYTAFAKNPIDQKWYNFDDSHVSAVSANEIKSSAAYLLFYSRKGSEPADLSKVLEMAQLPSPTTFSTSLVLRPSTPTDDTIDMFQQE